MIEAAVRLREAIWGIPLLVLLVGAGLYLTFLLRGLQLRRLFTALRLALVDLVEPDGDGDVSHFQALAISLSSASGAGNVLGVAVALSTGGPGALFWMWIAGFLVLIVRYAEAVLGVRYRETDVRGTKSGGPMYYLENGIRWGRIGRVLALAFAGLAVVAALGVGNGTQANAIASTLGAVTGLPSLAVGAVTALLAGAVLLSGVAMIGRVLAVVTPVALGAYLVGCGWLLWPHVASLPEVLRVIISAAFDPAAASGGAAGFTLARAMTVGFARGTLSGEAGLGTGAIAAAAARTREPVRQALVAMTGPFFDTAIVATATGLVMLTTGIGVGARLAGGPTALTAVMPSPATRVVFAVLLAALAFAALLAWGYYGERSARYLVGERAVVPFRLLFIAVIPLGAVLRMDAFWAVSDASRALMVLPNLAGLVLLSGIVVRESRAWTDRGSADQPSKRL